MRIKSFLNCVPLGVEDAGGFHLTAIAPGVKSNQRTIGRRSGVLGSLAWARSCFFSGAQRNTRAHALGRYLALSHRSWGF